MSLVSGNLPGDVGTFSLCPTSSNEAKFCVLFSSIANAYASVIGMCIPPSCSVANITTYVTTNEYLNTTYQYHHLPSPLQVDDFVFCSNEGNSYSGIDEPGQQSVMTTHDLIMIAVLGFWITLVVGATAVDYVKGFTLSSSPWQLVRRNSDGNIVHVVQPPSVANRRSWRSVVAADGNDHDNNTGGQSVVDRLRDHLLQSYSSSTSMAATTQGAAIAKQHRGRTHLWKRSRRTRNSTNTAVVNVKGETSLVEEPLLQQQTLVASATWSPRGSPSLGDTRNAANNASGGSYGAIENTIHQSITTPSHDGSSHPPSFPLPTTRDEMSKSPRSSSDTEANISEVQQDNTSISPQRREISGEDEHSVSPVAVAGRANSDGSRRRLQSKEQQLAQQQRRVSFNADNYDVFPSSDGGAVEQSRSGHPDSGAEDLGGSARLSTTLTDRIESWFGEERLEAFRERREALRQFVNENIMNSLPDFPDLPNFESLLVRAVLCLSLINSFRKWRYYPTTQASINIFNSLRVLAWLWIVAVDTFEYTMRIPTYTTPINESNNPLYALVQREGSSVFAISTFLIISGFTTMHRLITSEERPMSPAAIVMANSRSNMSKLWGYAVWYVKYFITRLVRLIPVYAAILFLLQPLLVRAGEGPFWPTFTTSGQLNENCRTHWWTNLLLINNFVPHSPENRCFAWSYYIALDFQLVLTAPFIHFAYKKMGHRGLIPFTTLITIGSVVLRYFFAEDCGELLAPPTRNSESIGAINQEPHFMILPFLAGVALYYAYRAVSQRQENIKLLGNDATMILLQHEATSKQIDFSDRASFWLLFQLHKKAFRVFSIWTGIAILLSCILGSWSLYRNESCDSSTSARAFSAVAPLAWCTGLCLIILPMLFGFGGNVRHFLIHRLWCGASRLVLSAYLLHPLVISFCNANKYAPVSMEFLLFVVDSWGNIGVSLIVAFFFHLGVEQPSIHLGS